VAWSIERKRELGVMASKSGGGRNAAGTYVEVVTCFTGGSHGNSELSITIWAPVPVMAMSQGN